MFKGWNQCKMFKRYTWVFAVFFFAAPHAGAAGEVTLSNISASTGIRSASIPLVLKGELTQGGLIFGKTEPGAQVWLNDSVIQVSEAGEFVFGFGRDAELSHVIRLKGADGRVLERSLELKKRHYTIQKIEGIARRIMEPEPEDLKRIRADVVMVQKARQTADHRLDYLDGFEWPVDGRITGVYGSQRYYNGVPKRPHYGIDIAAARGTIVTSPAPGKVTLAHKDMFYSGGTVIVDHGYGVSSTFLHMDEILVNVGDTLEKGDSLGRVGSTGRSTGPHLDWRINWFDQRIDPALVANGLPASAVGEP